MHWTIKADWYFVIPAALVWAAGLAVTAWDFIWLQELAFRIVATNVVGAVLIVIGIITRQIARRTLGKYFGSGLRTLPGHRLVKTGIYKHVRHPAYTGFLLAQIGTPLLFISFYGLYVMLLLIPCFLYRINIEEKMLIEKFGDEYLEYRRRSKRLVPCLW
ncbi:MAG: isoprenylcysteine carboxylmethyltransferase family protein [Chloroflexi bacterium]|nr:isoprenylcysteine carboxylmethyltransferase family protein [Chloroflexota bacterium]